MAQEATIMGIVFDEYNQPIPFADIQTTEDGTTSNENGFYQLDIPANETVVVRISYLGFESITARFKLAPNEEKEINFVLKTDVEQIGEVVITSNSRSRVEGITTLDPETVRRIPGANPGVENLLNTLPGVSSNNELSTQYSVRGGNYDENLVYVNEIEIYRPFLIRSGQQEGLSFVNSDLVRKVDFSAGGFKAQYGDKLSSVLDITYRRPVSFGGSFEASFLGGSASVEGISKNKKFSAIGGIRYRDNSLFVNAKQVEANFKPRFADAQTYMTYEFSNKFELSFLGNIAINTYDYEPFTRQTNFGTVQNPQALLVFYEGQEKDSYETYFGALKASYKPNDKYTAKLIASAYHTQEQEHFDILAQYRIGAVSSDFSGDNFGEVEFTEGAGSQFTHGRNNLDALIINVNHLGSYKEDNHLFEYGLKYTREDFRDRLQEYEVIDSAGVNIRPPNTGIVNDQPYNPFDGEIEPYERIRAFNETQINRFSGFAQWSYRTKINKTKAWVNAGVRAHNWTVSGKDITANTQTVVSPRAQISIQPEWKNDMVFRLSGGLYHQPPFYRELRDSVGQVVPDVKAQQAIHLVAGNDYSFKLWDRPFKLVSEAYYKDLSNVNPYTLENVRIRYRARNDVEAYAYGFDFRLNGEFVPGTESWVSLGYLQTEEKQDERGYYSRPTDQRWKFAILFQDYVKKFPKMKVYLNMVYNTGLPGGSPRFSDPFEFQGRLPDYQRVDAGFSYVFKEENEELPKNHLLSNFKFLSVGFEIFNIFDRLNSITNTFVRDASTRNQFAIPNYLSPRIFNLKLSARF
ncbi:MAG: TonB-dependent receptor [Bacteroidota bacterium]